MIEVAVMAEAGHNRPRYSGVTQKQTQKNDA